MGRKTKSAISVNTLLSTVEDGTRVVVVDEDNNPMMMTEAPCSFKYGDYGVVGVEVRDGWSDALAVDVITKSYLRITVKEF